MAVFDDILIFDELVFDVLGDGGFPLGSAHRPVKSDKRYADPHDYLRSWEFHELRIKLAGQRAAERARAAAMADEEYVRWEADVAAHHAAVTQSVVQKVSGMERNGVLPTQSLLSMSPEDFKVYKAWKQGLH
jgi:hypothetical protein